MDKLTLINIIKQCTNNKDFNEFCLVLTIINYLKDDDCNIISHSQTDKSIYITLKHQDSHLYLNFYSDNLITITLPFSGMFRINNCDYNIQYDEIKEILK